jgi:RNA polymerase sigma-70 factor (ECF subfamily)
VENDSRRGASNTDEPAKPVSFEVPDELVSRVRLGDKAAFERLVRSAFRPLWLFALGFTDSDEEAEDIVQDVFCRIWRMGVDWHPTGSARSYLYASVRNTAITVRNRKASEARIHERTVQEGGPERTMVPGPDAHFDGDDRAIEVWRAVAALSERRRSALRLRYEQELTVAEVGEALGITAKAAENILGRAIKELRKQVGAAPSDFVRSAAPVVLVAQPEERHETPVARVPRAAVPRTG